MPCEVIKDLLPLYIDQVCSESSKQLVEEHLAKCDSCKAEYTKMQQEIRLPQETAALNRTEANAIKEISAFWNRSIVKATLKGGLIAVLLCLVIFFGNMGLRQWNVLNVPSSIIEIADVSQLADGRIAYHVRLKDGYDLNQVSFNIDDKGNFYSIPRRPIIKAKPLVDKGLHNMYYIFDIAEIKAYQLSNSKVKDIEALYFGSKKDPVLVWKKGMKLPPANDKVEAFFTANEGELKADIPFP
ncbi:zf-HC2 domain-containing protein [Paenibacillus radicis (ex Gao et al. 2016)]|nr:zf-HC2 domain-containing protein [Paenibacillus radicis (ex Gao et al. 2016)]